MGGLNTFKSFFNQGGSANSSEVAHITGGRANVPGMKLPITCVLNNILESLQEYLFNKTLQHVFSNFKNILS